MKFWFLKRPTNTIKNRIEIQNGEYKCIDSLSREPLFGPHIKKLHGELEGKHRYEVGGIRIVYEVNTKSKTVEIKAIRSRGDVYKR